MAKQKVKLTAVSKVFKPRHRVMAPSKALPAIPPKIDRFAFLKDLANRPEARGIGAMILADLLLKQVMGQVDQSRQADLEGQSMDLQGQYGPQLQQADTERGISKAQREQAMLMLMRQMGVQGPNTADGEVYT